MTSQSLFRSAFWILLAGVLLMRIYFAVQVRRAGERLAPDRAAIEREGRVMFAFRVVMGMVLGCWLALYAIYPTWMGVLLLPFPAWLRWAGFALGIASLGLWSWTQVALGKEWSPQLQLRDQHHLVTTGPYGRVRHPLYTAMFAYSASLALVTANWFFVAFAVVAIAATLARVPKEEQMMIEEFGEEYRAYMQRTGRFFPK
ncbi:MAG TPA: isoprenylcysteine carboxylmethyltransferase family protein [Anaerolineae bacterium]|nr:isoprenylcysteine carboxylmethyltransferase family protein [Anaerolineae bacterium]